LIIHKITKLNAKREKNDECKSKNGLPLTGYANKEIEIEIIIKYSNLIFKDKKI
tara:strand:+ start:287 stop:448 length:162 start_codon:yes stop_codon:yes gene_type:complete